MVFTRPFSPEAPHHGTSRIAEEALDTIGFLWSSDPETDHRRTTWYVGGSLSPEGITMNILLIVIAVIAVILLFTGGFVQSLNFLLWVGIVLLVIAVIVWLVRMMTGSRRV